MCARQRNRRTETFITGGSQLRQRKANERRQGLSLVN